MNSKEMISNSVCVKRRFSNYSWFIRLSIVFEVTKYIQQHIGKNNLYEYSF